MSQAAKGKVNAIHTTLYTNLRFLMCSVKPPQKLKELVTEDMFVHNNSNVQGFLEVIHYLLIIWNEAKCKEKFKLCWPVLDQKQKSQFLRAACAIVQEMKEAHPEAQLPNITLSFFLQPGGDKFCSLMLRLSVFIMSFHISKDGPIVALPMQSNKKKESIKQMLNALTEPALQSSLQLHSKSIVDVNNTKICAQTCVDILTKLATEHDQVSSQLEQFLVSENKPKDLISKALNSSDTNALQGWHRLVQSKLDHADQLLQKLYQSSDKINQCHKSLETLLTSSNKHSIDGCDLKPQITDTLCKKLNTTQEELTSKLFSSGGTLKLQGLVETGSEALKIFSDEWAKQDIKPAEEALGKFQAIVDKSEKTRQEWLDIEQEFQKICSKLDEKVDKIYEKKKQEKQASGVTNISDYPQQPTGLSGASSLLAQIPCTPPWGLRAVADNVPSEEDTTFKESLSKLSVNFDKENLEIQRLFKLFKGEISGDEYDKMKKEEEEKVSSNLNFPSNFSLPVSKVIPTSPKRSHSPVSSVRFCVNQLLLPEAPPPCKDLRLSALKTKSHSSRYTPSYKQALHQRLLQLPHKSVVTPKYHSSPTYTASSYDQNQDLAQSLSTMDPMFVKQELESSNVKSEDPNSRDSGFVPSLSSSLSRQIIDSNISSDDGEVLFGDLSLQEIAELHLSLNSTPSNSPMNYIGINLSTHSPSPNFLAIRSGVSPRVPETCISSAVGSSPVLVSQPYATPRPAFLSPPAAGAASQSQGEDVKPSLTALMQRLQAIKSTMKQAEPVSRTGSNNLITPTQHKRPVIKLELESPP